MAAQNMLIVAVDGLRAAALGAYGNTTFPTPALDRFAADSFSLDCCYAHSPDLSDIYRGLWRSAPHAPSPPRLLRDAGYGTTLISDSQERTALASTEEFNQHVLLADAPMSPNAAMRAHDIAETSFARLFAAVGDVLDQSAADRPRFVWVHARGMYGSWDAPLELQAELLDDDDPPPVEAVAPPDFSISHADDPDAAFRYGCAYAAQAMVLDACWGELMQSMEDAGQMDEWLVMLIGVRGFPLGEHRRVGGVDPRLYVEQMHVPWLVRFPDGRGRLARTSRLVSHDDVLPTLVDWSGVPSRIRDAQRDGRSILPLTITERTDWRDAVVFVSDAGHRAIRTPEWCLRQTANVDDENAPADAGPTYATELYVRPDDRWEANDVAKLCPDVVETLQRSMDEWFARQLPQ